MGLRLDEWTVDWISLAGKEGMTNYTHLMTSGHSVYYLEHWHNFYRYSNQGWEQFNSQYRYIYFHRTQKGGSYGTHGELGSKMNSIGLWSLSSTFASSGSWVRVLILMSRVTGSVKIFVTVDKTGIVV
jgi:hypothetical protein